MLYTKWLCFTVSSFNHIRKLNRFFETPNEQNIWFQQRYKSKKNICYLRFFSCWRWWAPVWFSHQNEMPVGGNQIKNNNSNPVPGKKKTNRTIPGRKSGGKVIKSILAANDLCWHQTSHYGQHQRPTPAAPSPPQSINKVSDVDPHHQCTGYNQACHWSKLSKQFRIISE